MISSILVWLQQMAVNCFPLILGTLGDRVTDTRPRFSQLIRSVLSFMLPSLVWVLFWEIPSYAMYYHSFQLLSMPRHPVSFTRSYIFLAVSHCITFLSFLFLVCSPKGSRVSCGLYTNTKMELEFMLKSKAE